MNISIGNKITAILAGGGPARLCRSRSTSRRHRMKISHGMHRRRRQDVCQGRWASL